MGKIGDVFAGIERSRYRVGHGSRSTSCGQDGEPSSGANCSAVPEAHGLSWWLRLGLLTRSFSNVHTSLSRRRRNARADSMERTETAEAV